MTPREIDLILGRLTGMENTLREHGAQLGRIEEHAAATNGRVTAVEDEVTKVRLWKARMEGAKAALSWVPGLLTGVTGGGVVAGIAALIS